MGKYNKELSLETSQDQAYEYDTCKALYYTEVSKCKPGMNGNDELTSVSLVLLVFAAL